MEFNEVGSQIDSWISDGAVRGASIAIIHRGEMVYTHHAGESQPGVPVSGSTLFGLASLTKPINAAMFMALCDEGLISLDDAVTDILPEFGADVDPLTSNAMLEAERDTITFRQLLAHTSGLPEHTSLDLFDPSSLGSRDQQIEMMMRVPLASAPLERLRYSNIGHGIAARAAEEVSGEEFPDLIRSRILEPMNLGNIVLEPDDEQASRIAILEDPASEGTDWETYNSAWWRETAVPWGGFYGSAIDMARFTASFLPGGSSVLSSEAIEAMTTDQVHGLEGGVESMYTTWQPGFWGVGWEIKGTKPRHWTGNRTSPQTWDHWGFAGTLAWADPTRDLAVAVFANRSVKSLWMFRPTRWATLSDTICDLVGGQS